MSPSRRSRRDSREPVLSRGLTSSLTRSSATAGKSSRRTSTTVDSAAAGRQRDSVRRPLALVLAIAAVAGAVTRGSSADPASAKPTYVRNVAPILDGRCISCHSRGGVAPFPLTSYREARQHRTEIAAVVASRRMPPWHADSQARAYLYDPSLTASQVVTIVRWVRAGAPQGRGSRGAPLAPLGGGLS